jgi:DNA-damage-inducible protein D
MSEYPVEVFSYESDSITFEDIGRENGMRYWLASDLMDLLGYGESPEATRKKPVNKAMAACAALNIPISENFLSFQRDGSKGEDYKLSRFACYLTAMNGDSRKPQVAAAQAYFASLAEAFSSYAQEIESVDRIVTRDELSTQEKSLSSTAKKAGVIDYALFQNAGYRGMYNMNLSQIRNVKRVPSGRSPLDFMGSTELAANLFRITQTDEKVKRAGIVGQKPLESTAEEVGREVRKTMQRISGILPEHLPAAQDLNNVRKGLKATYKGLKAIDAKPKKKAKKESDEPVEETSA